MIYCTFCGAPLAEPRDRLCLQCLTCRDQPLDLEWLKRVIDTQVANAIDNHRAGCIHDARVQRSIQTKRAP